MQPTALGGPAEVAINGTLIPSTMLSEVAASFVEGIRERKTLGGTFRRPSGMLETAELTFTLFLPSMDYLKNVFPGRYNAPTAPQTSGNVIINSETSATVEGGPVNVHFTGDTTDKNDIHIYNGVAVLDFSAVYNADDDLAIPVRIMAQPDENGNVGRLGTGSLTAVSVWDPVAEATEPVA